MDFIESQFPKIKHQQQDMNNNNDEATLGIAEKRKASSLSESILSASSKSS